MKTPLHKAGMALLLLFVIATTVFLASCARTPGRQTSALSGHLAAAATANTAARNDAAFIRSNLSRADGKAEVILEWFRQHRSAPSRP